MLLILLLLLVHVPSCFLQEPTIIDFNTPYRNLTTKGKLVPNLYEIPPTNETKPFAVRVVLISRDESREKPVSLVMMRGLSYMSTFIPRIQTYDGVSEGYYFLAETLCEENNFIYQNNETVRLTVSSSVPARYELAVKQIHHFIIEMEPRTVALSPSEPVFYRFSFPEFVDTIAVRVSSLDNLCGRVTIQKADASSFNEPSTSHGVYFQCPVFDTEGEVVLYEAYNHQTFTQKSFITVKKEEFGEDIHIIFSVLPGDSPCRSRNGLQTLHNVFDSSYRLKNITAEIEPFRPSTIPMAIILIGFFAVLGLVYFTGLFVYVNSQDDNPDDKNFDKGVWNLSLSRIFAILPVAIIAILRHYDSHLAKETDMCNHNYECAIPIGPFKAANGMLSASSIFFMSLISMTLMKHAKCPLRFFPLNSCIMLTGIFWTIMNYCPQKHSFHLFTLSMILITLEAKFVLFEMRNQRHTEHHHFVGSLTFLLMTFIVTDSAWDNRIVHIISIYAIFVILVVYACVFTWFHGNEWFKRDPGIPVIPLEPEAPPVNVAPNAQEVGIPEIPTFDVIPTGSHETSTSADDQEPLLEETEPQLPVRLPAPIVLEARQNIVKAYFGLSIGNIVFWSAYGWLRSPLFDTPIVTLRILQCDLALYFVFFCVNRVIDIKRCGVHRKDAWRVSIFCLTTVLLIAGVVLWWFISAFRMPAYIRWSPAESRVFNQKCLFETVGMDWHELRDYQSAVMCILYVFVIFQIDRRLELENERAPF